MGGKMSRNKGQRGEREVVKLLQPIVDKVYSGMGQESPKLARNLVQSRSGGYDLVGLEWLALEVKFQESFNLKDWWVQTLKQANENQEPVLIYRKSHIKWRVQMLGVLPLGCTGVVSKVDIDLEMFCQWFELMVELKA